MAAKDLIVCFNKVEDDDITSSIASITINDTCAVSPSDEYMLDRDSWKSLTEEISCVITSPRFYMSALPEWYC